MGCTGRNTSFNAQVADKLRNLVTLMLTYQYLRKSVYLSTYGLTLIGFAVAAP